MKDKSVWERLGIEPTQSKKEIRKAYAAQAKLHHLEEEPETFVELKDAYQKALQYAENITIFEEPEENRETEIQYQLSATEILKILGYTRPQTSDVCATIEEFEKQYQKVPAYLKEYMLLAFYNPLLSTADIWTGDNNLFWNFLYHEIERINKEEDNAYPEFSNLPKERWNEVVPDYLIIGSDYSAGVVVYGIRVDDMKKENPPVYMNHEADDITEWRLLWKNISDYLLSVTCDVLLCVQYNTAFMELTDRHWNYSTCTFPINTSNGEKWLLSEHGIRISDLYKVPSIYSADFASEYVSCCYHKEKKALYLVHAAEKELEISIITKEQTQSDTDKSNPISDKTRNQEEISQSSLLNRLKQEEGRKAEESRKQGALHDFIEIFEDENRKNYAKVWQGYFLSENFLKEQQEEQFLKGVNEYLKSQQDRIPDCFWIESAIAYGLFEEEKRFTIYSDRAGGSGTRKTATAFLNESADATEKNNGILYKIENMARLRAFSDYLMLKRMNRQGYLTEKERTIWEKILYSGRSRNLYERNRNDCILEETRSECVIVLYTYWLRSEKVPLLLCSYMYKEYNLKNIEHSNTVELYAELKEAILQQYPNIEAELFGESGRTQKIDSWNQELMKIVSDYCNHRVYEESDDIKERITELFERNEWQQIKYDTQLFHKIHQQLANRKIIPVSLAQRLYDFYLTEGNGYQEEEKVQELLEGLIQSIHIQRRSEENDYRRIYPYQETSVTDIGENHRRFWEYFLMTGFDCRYTTVIGASQKEADYIQENKQYLPGYIRAIYMPSMEWCKLFTNFDEEKNTIINPVSTSFPLPDGRKIRVEFHLHYINYFVEEQPVIYPVFSFQEFCTYAEHIQKTEEFFFLLAITAIEKEEQQKAYELIKKWLKRLPLYAATIPYLAEALAADNARSEIPENEKKRIQAIYYSEQERFCFKAEVFMRVVKLYRQTNVGWEEMSLLDGEGKKAKLTDLEGKKQFAEWKVKQMMQPKPIKIKSFSLSGMSNEERMVQVIEALKEQEKIRTEEKRKGKPYRPGFPWSPEEITEPVRAFFAKDGGWMTESFVVLHMGTQKKRCFERIFYSTMNIFGFDLSFQSREYVLINNRRTEELRKKIKENHLVVGRFGWGKQYEVGSSFAPIPFAIGESGAFYACDSVHLYRENSLAALMAKIFDFTEVSQITIYKNRLSVSRFDHTLEYCYTDEDMHNWMYSKVKMLPELFTKFGI